MSDKTMTDDEAMALSLEQIAGGMYGGYQGTRP